MKAILISIKPKWVAKILDKEKTIEVRKTMPKCDLPIDVYIYCTKSNYFGYISKNYIGKVVAKFTLNKVERIMFMNGVFIDETRLLKQSCLNEDELFWYLAPQNTIVRESGYAWHISNLVIFDKPKELSEFIQSKRKNYEEPQVQKVPQSWCYIEVEE